MQSSVSGNITPNTFHLLPDSTKRTRLNTEINKILSSREIQEYVAKIMFADTAAMSRDEFAKFYRGELGRYKDLLSRANIPQE